MDFVNCLYDYGLNWISLGPITRINLKVRQIIEPGITQCWVIGGIQTLSNQATGMLCYSSDGKIF